MTVLMISIMRVLSSLMTLKKQSAMKLSLGIKMNILIALVTMRA